MPLIPCGSGLGVLIKGGNPGVVRPHAQAEKATGLPGDSPLLLLFVHRGAGRGYAQSVTEAKMAACSSRREKGLPKAFP